MPLFDENERLCTAAQQGDEQARTELVLRNLGFCTAVARRYLTTARFVFHCEVTGRAAERTSGNLDDLTQSAVVGLLESVNDWDPERGSFLTYAEMHMRNSIRALLGLRSTKRTLDTAERLARLDAPMGEGDDATLSDLLPDPNATDPERNAVRRDVVAVIHRCLSLLSPEDRELLMLRHLRGLPDYQIAERCGKGISWTQYHLRRAEQRLRQMDKLRSLHDASCDPRRGGTKGFQCTRTSTTEEAVLLRESRRLTQTKPKEL